MFRGGLGEGELGWLGWFRGGGFRVVLGRGVRGF